MASVVSDISQNKVARVTGVSYLLIIAAGIFAEFFVRSNLIVQGDATSTANNIMASEFLFRIGIAGDLVMIVFDIVVALTLYVLLRPINRSLALLAALFRLIQASILGANTMNLSTALQFLGGADYLNVLGTDQLNALAMSSLEAHSMGYDIGLVFFAISTLILGYLLYKSNYVPRILAALLPLAALVYLVGSSVRVLMPAYVDMISLAYFLPFIVELSLALWLSIKGVNLQAKEDRILATATA